MKRFIKRHVFGSFSLWPSRRNWCWAAACLSPAAWALGFGPAHGVQHVGRPFYAEIPLHSAENLSSSCLAVAPVAGEEMYFPGDMQFAIEGRALARRLVLTSPRALREPLVVFQLRAACDVHLARDYALIAEAPLRPEPARVSEPPASVQPPPLAPGAVDDEATLIIQRPTTLNAMARELYPEDRAARDRFRAAYAAANPALFEGIEHVGAVALARGTRLQRPRDLADAAARQGRSAVPESPRPMSKLPAAGAASKDQRGDRLTLGGASSQMKILSDAILRLEQGHAERERLQGELVGAVSGAVNGIVELRDQLRGQESDLQRLRVLLEQERRNRERDKAEMPGLVALLGLILTGGLVGAGLMLLHHRLSQRRQPATPAAFDLGGAAAVAVPPQNAMDGPLAAVVADAPLVMPPPQVVKAPPEAVTAPVVPQPAVPSAAVPAPGPSTPPVEPKQELGLDDLMDAFQQHSAEVAASVQQIRGTNSRDLAEWLDLVQTARQAGLLNESSMVDMAREFRRMFNVDLDGSTEGSIESFPRVRKGLISVWGKRAVLGYIDGLIYDDRDGTRTGFPEAVAYELLLLRDVARTRAEQHGFDDDPHPFDDAGHAHDLDARVDADAPPRLRLEGVEIPSLRRSQAVSAEREFSIEFDLGELKRPPGDKA